ncbi:polyribonucleotide nucleotidyltransferase [Lacticigenium naphthae]|uniref:polyribonucleotide nucleotidyltransferase n=1 Tax=Lacticigenium naphthae TaxID=515351 RepID=UPI000407C09B|nr:polyribonucleotide nucleotidyltransferase [Lacticigenium naphthae]
MTNKKIFSKEIAGRTLTVEIGQLAKQANGAVLVRYGDTAVLTAVVASKSAGTADFFPLTVNYEEKMYAVGKIPGGFIKREGRPSENATLTARLIDRPIRPMFDEGFRNEVQITNTVLSVDQDCSPEITAMFGSSIALCVSDIPFHGPIAGVNVGRVDGQYVLNPTEAQELKSDIQLTVAGSGEAINMVESGALEVPEDEMLEALLFGHEAIKELVHFQEEITEVVGKEKMTIDLVLPSEELVKEIHAEYTEEMKKAIQIEEKMARSEKTSALKEEIVNAYQEKYHDDENIQSIIKDVKKIVDGMEKDEVRRLITEEKVRPDGRKINEIRPLDSEISLLPRVHGSGLFTRGQTQALSVATLAPLKEHQLIDGLGTNDSKQFMHHYNFPQYSVGETSRRFGPGRREIGHGALGERALSAVLPDESDFPYTIRLVAEVLESNGSSSQASICAGTLALMDAGVPIKAPVGGIAMGLVMENDNYTVLTDIQGLEDHLGDMDFKVAGTRKGITALQMDIKIQGITTQILSEALTQARKARMEILDNLEATISEPKKELSEYAPKIESIKIKPAQIKVVIGKGGETINGIIDETGVKIDIDEEGNVNIYGQDPKAIQHAIDMIGELTEEVEVGKIYNGTVKRIEKFGAFVEIIKGKDGLVHVSELSDKYISDVESVISVGDKIEVKVTEVDRQGRVNLSHKAVMKEREESKE